MQHTNKYIKMSCNTWANSIDSPQVRGGVGLKIYLFIVDYESKQAW